MQPRPKDFFGFEDWSGGDPQDDIDWIAKAQASWDEAWAKLPWWQKLRHILFGFD
jgi:hypothetical protein